MNRFPALVGKSWDSLMKWIEQVISEREKDRSDWDNLPQIYMLGRNRTLLNSRAVPSGSSDVVATDAEGDFMADASYIYVLIDNGGTLAWRRVALASW